MRVMLATFLVVLVSTYGYAESKPAASPLCPVCETVATYVEGLLKKNETQAEIKQELESFCSDLPSLLSGPCKMVVDTYLVEIIEKLTNMTAEQVCTEIDLCSSILIRTVSPNRLSPKNSIACQLCELGVSAINESLANNATQQEIVDDVKKLCDALPGALGSLCDSLVQQYAPQLFEMFEKDDPEQLCTDIDLCSGEFKRKNRFLMLPTK